MRHLVAVLVCALVVLGTARQTAHAQFTTPATAPNFETEPFSSSELLRGKRITQPECAALPGGVWVAVDQQGECIRYYHSAAGGSGPEAVVLVSSEVASTNARGELKPYDFYVKLSPAAMQDQSVRWSRSLRMPYIYLGRPGTYGSSGEYAKRRTAREIDLVSAALDAIKTRHGYTRLHLAGYSEGGHAPAALLARRTDVRCVVLASSLLSIGSLLAESGRDQDVTGNKHPRRSGRARSSGGEALRSSHHCRNRPGRCRHLGALADHLCEACQCGRLAGAADLGRCVRRQCAQSFAHRPIGGGGLCPRRQRKCNRCEVSK